MRALLISIGACLLMLLSSCARTQENRGGTMSTTDETEAILNVITKLEEAANTLTTPRCRQGS